MADGRGKYEVAAKSDNDSEQGSGGFCSFLYNSRDGSILGRTCSSWAKITVFYIIYYACLAGFFVGMLSVFLYGIIQTERPHLTGEHSLLVMNPGLGFKPQPQPEYTLVSFTAGKNDTYASYVRNLQELYNSYKKTIDNARSNSSCQPNSLPDKEPMKVCEFNWDNVLSSCGPHNNFGFSIGKPCIVLKMNKIFGWMPDPIDASIPHSIVECHGENAADDSNIGDLAYYPSVKSLNNASTIDGGYFSSAYYPYLNQPQYQAPLVAVQFQNIRRNTLVMIECRLQNLNGSVYSKIDKQAMARFEVFMQE